MDFACFVSTVLFACSNLLLVLSRAQSTRNEHFDRDLWYDLDPFYLKYTWQHDRVSSRALTNAAGLLSASAWLVFCVPVANVAWILSHRGRRNVVMHVAMGALAMGASTAEVLARLMTVGMTQAAEWIAREFNLDHWKGENSFDGMGWKVLEISYMTGHGIILWMDALEWLALFGVLALIFFSVRSDRDASPFGWKWSVLGLMIGILSLFNFVAEILRLQSWMAYMDISLAISIINTLVLMPLWLIILGRQLPYAKKENEESSEIVPFVGNASDDKDELRASIHEVLRRKSCDESVTAVVGEIS